MANYQKHNQKHIELRQYKNGNEFRTTYLGSLYLLNRLFKQSVICKKINARHVENHRFESIGFSDIVQCQSGVCDRVCRRERSLDFVTGSR